MIVAAAKERSLGGHAEPEVPVQVRRHRVAAPGSAVPLALAPVLAAPAVDLFYFADGAGLDGGHDGAVLGGRVDLDAHLRYPLATPGRALELAGLVDRLRQRFLGVDVQALV